MLPAYAGMIPGAPGRTNREHRAPRVCGDDPILDELGAKLQACSPRMRG